MNFPAKSLAARLIPDTPRADLYTHTHKTFWETSFPQSFLTSSPSRAACWTWWSCFLGKGESLHLPCSPSFPPQSLTPSLPLRQAGFLGQSMQSVCREQPQERCRSTTRRSTSTSCWWSGTWEWAKPASSSAMSTRTSPPTTGPPSGWTLLWRCWTGMLRLWWGCSSGILRVSTEQSPLPLNPWKDHTEYRPQFICTDLKAGNHHCLCRLRRENFKGRSTFWRFPKTSKLPN